MSKPMWAIVLLALAITMAGCSNNNGSSSTNVNGNWSASLTDSQTGQPVYAFTTTLTETSGGGSVSISNFTFTSTGTCFVEGQTTETGNFTLSGDFSGNVKGTFGMTVSSISNTGTQLVLQGGVGANNTITGTWNLTGTSACSGNGNFTFARM